MLGGHALEPRLHAEGLEADRVIRPDPRTGWLTITQADPRPEFVGRYESGWRYPATIGHHRRPSRQPVAIVDHDVRVALSLDINEVRANQATPTLRPWPHSQGSRNFARERGRAQEQFMDRAC